MAKEDKPLEYERRIQDTKGLAQRLDLFYVNRVHWLRSRRRNLSWILALAAMVASLPFLFGVRTTEKALVNGPVSKQHAIFEAKCELCHRVNFTEVRDQDCKTCHDGAVHQVNAMHEVKCIVCHSEHIGTVALADMKDSVCTDCHANLTEHGRNLKTKAVKITKFQPERHPAFAAVNKKDERPLKLNHAVHMPAQAKVIRGLKLPMKCGDCHQIDMEDRRGGLMAVTFERHCASCHKRELEFDVYGVLSAAAPAPHNKSPQSIRTYIAETYTKALQANPQLWRKPLRPDVEPPATPQLWLAMAIKESDRFLFEKKCKYCHEVEGFDDGLPRIAKVNAISGQFVAGKAQGERWMGDAEFGHRTHRMVECSSCHTDARKSVKTSDVLLPKMETCLPCHGSSGTGLDNCAQCHVYHDKTKEKDRDRRSIEELLSETSLGERLLRTGDHGVR